MKCRRQDTIRDIAGGTSDTLRPSATHPPARGPGRLGTSERSASLGHEQREAPDDPITPAHPLRPAALRTLQRPVPGERASDLPGREPFRHTIRDVPRLTVSKRLRRPPPKHDPGKEYQFRYRAKKHGSLPHVVKFSGGRSSGMLLFALLENGLLDASRGDVIVFNLKFRGSKWRRVESSPASFMFESHRESIQL